MVQLLFFFLIYYLLIIFIFLCFLLSIYYIQKYRCIFFTILIISFLGYNSRHITEYYFETCVFKEYFSFVSLVYYTIFGLLILILLEYMSKGNIKQLIREKKIFLYKFVGVFLIGLATRIVLNYFGVDILICDLFNWLLSGFFVNGLCAFLASLPHINIESLSIYKVSSSIQCISDVFYNNKLNMYVGTSYQIGEYKNTSKKVTVFGMNQSSGNSSGGTGQNSNNNFGGGGQNSNNNTSNNTGNTNTNNTTITVGSMLNNPPIDTTSNRTLADTLYQRAHFAGYNRQPNTRGYVIANLRDVGVTRNSVAHRMLVEAIENHPDLEIRRMRTRFTGSSVLDAIIWSSNPHDSASDFIRRVLN